MKNMERVKINKEKKEVLVSFNEKFYTKEAIEQAILDFQEVCDVKREEKGLLLVPKKKEDLELLGYEFYNYVLGVMRNQ